MAILLPGSGLHSEFLQTRTAMKQRICGMLFASAALDVETLCVASQGTWCGCLSLSMASEGLLCLLTKTCVVHQGCGMCQVSHASTASLLVAMVAVREAGAVAWN